MFVSCRTLDADECDELGSIITLLTAKPVQRTRDGRIEEQGPTSAWDSRGPRRYDVSGINSIRLLR